MPHIPDSRHADHDPLLVAAYAAGDATGPELDEAQALVAACAECAALHHDLRAIAAALPALPAPVRPRDFRLTPEQAATLRPAGWRRLLAPLAGPRFAFAGPLGTGLATLGIAGLLVAGSLGAPLAATPTGGGTGAPNLAAAPATGGPESVPQTASSAAPSAAPANLAAGATPASVGGAVALPVPAEQPSASRDTDGGGTAWVLGSAAASARADAPYATIQVGSGGGVAGAMPDGSPDEKGAEATGERLAPVSTTATSADSATDTRLETAAPAVPVLGLAVAALAAGLLLAGLRLAARRLA